MNKALNNLLRLSASHYPLVLSQSQLAEYHDAVNVLNSLGIVKESNPDFWVNCTNCDHAHKAEVIDGKYIVVCDVDPDVGAYEVTEDEIKQSKLHYSELCAWIASQLRLSGNAVTDDEVIWNLGYASISGKRYTFYFLRSTDYSELEKRLQNLGVDYPIVIWLGTHPPTGSFPANVIDIEELLDIQDGKLLLDQSLINTHLPAKATTADGDLLLHEDIAASKSGAGNYLLKIGLRPDNSFINTPTITEMQYNIILNLFHNHTPRKSAEINQGKAMALNDRTVTLNIGRINKMITDLGKLQLIVRSAGNRYQLNPNLDCFRKTSS